MSEDKISRDEGVTKNVALNVDSKDKDVVKLSSNYLLPYLGGSRMSP